jgi:hypothetical protein
MTSGPVHSERLFHRLSLRSIVYLLILSLLMATVVYPIRRYVVEPQRESLLGRHQTPALRLALASEFGFDMASGCTIRMVPGEPLRNLGDLPTDTATVLIGGFRGPYVVWLWVKSQEERQSKGHLNLINRYRQIAALQSDYPVVWTFLTWDVGWNVSVQWQSQEQRYHWVRLAIEFLNEGARKNPHSVEILGQMGWIYAEKLGHSQEAPFFRKRIKEDEGRSTFLIAYEWYDRARKAGDRYGDLGHGFSRPVQYSQACHAVTYYATETTQDAYDTLAAAAEAHKAGRTDEAALKFAEGRKQMDEAVRAWVWAHQEWNDHITRFEKDEVSPDLGEAYQRFRREADQWTKVLQTALDGMTIENTSERLSKFERPEIK